MLRIMLNNSRLASAILPRSRLIISIPRTSGPSGIRTTAPLAVRFQLTHFSSRVAVGPSVAISALKRPTTSAVSNRWKRIARILRYLRIPALIVSVYGLGYQQGIIDYSTDPKAQEAVLFQQAVAGVGCTDMKKVQIHYDGEHPFSLKRRGRLVPAPIVTNPRLRQVARVGKRIVNIAQKELAKDLKEASAKVIASFPNAKELTEEQLYAAAFADETVQEIAKSLNRLEGDQPWSYVLIDSPIANAFVSEILPYRIFITTSMFDLFIENEDELALVLGHEVSHLILGHVSKRNEMETVLRTLEILLLSMDPTEGLLSLGVISGLALIRNAIGASFSRENEREADDMGLKLAAMACYDTKRASHVFKKMHDLGTESSKEKGEAPSPRWLSFMDSHPPTIDRHELLLQNSEKENAAKYEETCCATVSTRLRGALETVQKR